MSDKYIVKNCPSYDDYFNPNETCRKKYSQYCQDCTDCVLKQVVEKCNKIKKDHYWGMREIRFSKEILELLDIQEVE